METRCKKCGKILTGDEIAVYRKLVNRGAQEYLCMDCLARYFNCPRKLIEDKIVYFKRTGCTLFL